MIKRYTTFLSFNTVYLKQSDSWRHFIKMNVKKNSCWKACTKMIFMWAQFSSVIQYYSSYQFETNISYNDIELKHETRKIPFSWMDLPSTNASFWQLNIFLYSWPKGTMWKPQFKSKLSFIFTYKDCICNLKISSKNILNNIYSPLL